MKRSSKPKLRSLTPKQLGQVTGGTANGLNAVNGLNAMNAMNAMNG